jgi:hypothetical protein
VNNSSLSITQELLYAPMVYANKTALHMEVANLVTTYLVDKVQHVIQLLEFANALLEQGTVPSIHSALLTLSTPESVQMDSARKIVSRTAMHVQLVTRNASMDLANSPVRKMRKFRAKVYALEAAFAIF